MSETRYGDLPDALKSVRTRPLFVMHKTKSDALPIRVPRMGQRLNQLTRCDSRCPSFSEPQRTLPGCQRL
jgi:hypothetical protein